VRRLATVFFVLRDFAIGETASKPPDRTRRRRQCVAALSVAAAALLLAPAAAARPTTKFVSKRYGYSIVFPGRHSRWAASFATEDWSSDLIGGIGAPGIDTFRDLKTGRSYLLAARQTDYESPTVDGLRRVGPIAALRNAAGASGRNAGRSARTRL
jgi:hypothetical protein